MRQIYIYATLLFSMISYSTSMGNITNHGNATHMSHHNMTELCTKQQLALLGNQTGDSICVKEMAKGKSDKELRNIPNIIDLPITKILFYSPACKNSKCMGLFKSLKKLQLHCNVIVMLPKHGNDTQDGNTSYYKQTENIKKILNHAIDACNKTNITNATDRNLDNNESAVGRFSIFIFMFNLFVILKWIV